MSSRSTVEAWLERWTKETGTGRLPSIRELSRLLDASPGLVQSVLKPLRQSGILESRPGSGIWLAGRVPSRSLRVRLDANQLAERILEEIRSGLLAWNEMLPTAKDLARNRSCHPQTAAKALRLLVAQGHLRRVGRRHVPARPVVRGARVQPAILCVGAGDEAGTLRMDSDRELDFWRELGNAAAEAGIRMVREPWRNDRIQAGKEVVGVVASTWHIQDLEDLYARLDRTGRPVCVWVEDLGFRPGVARHHPRLHFHDQGYGAQAGSVLARHVLDQGHGKLAWISPWHASAWSRNRLEGIFAASKEHGARVERFCLDGRSEWDRLAPAWAESESWTDFPAPELERIVEGSVASLRRRAIEELGWNRIRRDMEPLAEKAAASGATAWICANDSVAVRVRDWCGARGLRIPEDVALCGFDDSTQALRADLTSYRFATVPMVRSMMRQILSDRPEPGVSRHAGMVVARGSTARR